MEVAVAELRVVTVSIEQRVRAMRVDPLGLGDRFGASSVVLLATQLQYRHVSATEVPSVASCVTSGKILFPAGWPDSGTRPHSAGPRSLA